MSCMVWTWWLDFKTEIFLGQPYSIFNIKDKDYEYSVFKIGNFIQAATILNIQNLNFHWEQSAPVMLHALVQNGGPPTAGPPESNGMPRVIFILKTYVWKRDVGIFCQSICTMSNCPHGAWRQFLLDKYEQRFCFSQVVGILTSNLTTWLKQNLCSFLLSKNCLQATCVSISAVLNCSLK